MSGGMHTPTIVVIDSEPIVRDVVAKILQQAGFEVVTTGNFDQAIQMMKTRTPDLVLTNVYLRGITGHDAMRQIKGLFPDLRVLMVSGLPDDGAIQNWLSQDGFDAFPKPFTADALVQKVRQVLAA